MADSTLAAIRTKVRRLTRSLSTQQLSDAQIDEYINTFVLYDFPEHLRLFNLYKTFEFFTEPYIDVYETTTSSLYPLYNFKNNKITVHPPIYIAGFQALFLESREQLYRLYPMLNNISSIGSTGNGIDVQFTGTVNAMQGGQGSVLVRENVLFSSIQTNGDGLAMIDYPINPTIGNLYIPGLSPSSTVVQDPVNYINYTTGQFVVTFINPPAAGAAINSQTVQVQTSLPKTVLFFDGKFTLRPVPDQPYRVNMEVYVQPTELILAGQSPDLEEWWQYIAYGAAKKVFEDRMDIESIQQIMPEYKKQENLVQRKTIVQMTSQKVATIFDNQDGTRSNNNWGSSNF
jgi:hypothetical protein